MTDAAQSIVRQLRTVVVQELLRLERGDLLESMADGQIEMQENGDGTLRYLVAGEIVLDHITLTPGGAIVH